MKPKKMYVCEIFTKIGNWEYSYKVLEEAYSEQEACNNIHDKMSSFEKRNIDRVIAKEVVYADSKT